MRLSLSLRPADIAFAGTERGIVSPDSFLYSKYASGRIFSFATPSNSAFSYCDKTCRRIFPRVDASMFYPSIVKGTFPFKNVCISPPSIGSLTFPFFNFPCIYSLGTITGMSPLSPSTPLTAYRGMLTSN